MWKHVCVCSKEFEENSDSYCSFYFAPNDNRAVNISRPRRKNIAKVSHFQTAITSRFGRATLSFKEGDKSLLRMCPAFVYRGLHHPRSQGLTADTALPKAQPRTQGLPARFFKYGRQSGRGPGKRWSRVRQILQDSWSISLRAGFMEIKTGGDEKFTNIIYILLFFVVIFLFNMLRLYIRRTYINLLSYRII